MVNASKPVPSAVARGKQPWLWQGVPNKEAWDQALAQAAEYAHAIEKIQGILDEYDNSGSQQIATVRNKLKDALKQTKLAMLSTINPITGCPHPLNRPFEKNRMVDVANQIVQAGFDLNLCNGACAVEDVPNTCELDNYKALRCRRGGGGRAMVT